MSDEEKVEVIEKKKNYKASTRRERLEQCRLVDEVRSLDKGDLVTFYMADNTIRYYMRILDPRKKKGVAVFHANKKGRPAIHFLPEFTIPAGVDVMLLFKREISENILQWLFYNEKERKKARAEKKEKKEQQNVNED